MFRLRRRHQRVSGVYTYIQYGDKTTAEYPSNTIILYYINGGHRKNIPFKIFCK